jgi:glycosyltransferase involved in cell wall biosynthesis
MGNAQINQVRFAEVLHQLAVRVPNPSQSRLYRFLSNSSFKLFSRKAYVYSRYVDQSNEATLLIRSGFGSAFFYDTRKFVSDASLPHPNVLQSLIKTGEMRFDPVDSKDVVSNLILRDTERADTILVNSDFVKDTFIFAGVKADKIVVAYLPPTGIFRSFALEPSREINCNRKKLRILFAGTLEERKGIHEILTAAEAALEKSLEFEFTLIGNWGPGTALFQERMKRLPNCKFVKWKSQVELAKNMQNSDVFLFPSRAEGGARVVTEAMCMGMPIITTYNSGSPINHLQEGIIIEPLDPSAILEWLVFLSNDDSFFRKLGEQSRNKIRFMLTQDTYLDTIRRVCNL